MGLNKSDQIYGNPVYMLQHIKINQKQGISSPEISHQQVQKLTPQFVLIFIHILDIDSHCPYLLFGEIPSHLTNKWRALFNISKKMLEIDLA